MRRERSITFKVNYTEYASLSLVADQNGLPLSALIRHLIFTPAGTDGKLALINEKLDILIRRTHENTNTNGNSPTD